MSDEMVKVYRGKANNIELESIHGKVSDIFEMSIDSIERRRLDMVELAKAKAEADNEPYVEPYFVLSKEELSLLAEAQKFLKANNIEVSIIKKSGSKSFSSKINKFNKEKKELILP